MSWWELLFRGVLTSLFHVELGVFMCVYSVSTIIVEWYMISYNQESQSAREVSWNVLLQPS